MGRPDKSLTPKAGEPRKPLPNGTTWAGLGKVEGVHGSATLSSSKERSYFGERRHGICYDSERGISSRKVGADEETLSERLAVQAGYAGSSMGWPVAGR